MTTSLKEATHQLEAAATAAPHAPSVFNTPPWRWRIAGNTMDLYADRAGSCTPPIRMAACC